MSGVGSQPAKALQFMPQRRLATGTRRELRLALGFFTVFRLLVAVAALAVMTVLAQTIGRVPAVAGAAGTVTALLQVDRMLGRARRDLVDTRRAMRWAEARAEQRGGASASELLAGFHLFDRWLSVAMRKSPFVARGGPRFWPTKVPTGGRRRVATSRRR